MRKAIFGSLLTAFLLCAGSALAISAIDRTDEWIPSASPVGSWFGRAYPLHPESSPFPEVWMSPSFLRDGVVIANDSHETTNPHTTSHGQWYRTSDTDIVAVFIWINLVETAPNGYGGTFKVTIHGSVSPDSPDVMTGQVHAIFYPPNLNPMDPGAAGIDVGVFQIDGIKRIRADQLATP